MKPVRHGWAAIGLFAFFAVWTVVVGEPLALLGLVGLGGWLLAVQARFVADLDRVDADLAVDHSPRRTRVVAGETTPVEVTVEIDPPTPIALRVRPTLPPAAVASPPPLHLDAGDREASATVDVTWPVAGEFTLDQAVVTAHDRAGLFEQRVSAGSEQPVSVEPRTPRDVHVGAGGERIAATLGEHAAARQTGGIEPLEVRPYVPGDAFHRIDWKATARLGDPHVREFEGESDRPTVLIVDHRASTGRGEAGTRALDFARQVALAFVDTARADADPLGCVTVGDGGLTGSFEPRAHADHYVAVRDHVQGLEPTAGGDDPALSVDVSRATALHARLDGDETAFGQGLAPFFERRTAYVERVAERPLFRAVRTANTRLGASALFVIVTDDATRIEVREASKAARRAGGGVLVFLTPAVLFDTDRLSDFDDAYDRYVEFESFRQDLASLDGVSAFEVGPEDRLSAILATGTSRNRRRTEVPGQ